MNHPLEQWLSTATHGLSTESTARVRSEIQQHYDLACEAGDDAITALGNPKAANRAYRKVLLTKREVAVAPTLTQSRWRIFWPMLIYVLIAQLGRQLSTVHGSEFWPMLIATNCISLFPWLFLPATPEQSRRYLCICGGRSALMTGLGWWFCGWVCGSFLGAAVLGLFSLEYFINRRRIAIFRKLAAGQIYTIFPEDPCLTPSEAVYVHGWRKASPPYEDAAIAGFFAIFIGLSVWQTATFLPMTMWMAVCSLIGRTLPIYTEERSRWFRIMKWTTMIAAGVAPFLCRAWIPWMGSSVMAFLFSMFDIKGISIRRKLTIEQWPRGLYW